MFSKERIREVIHCMEGDMEHIICMCMCGRVACRPTNLYRQLNSSQLQYGQGKGPSEGLQSNRNSTGNAAPLFFF